MTSTAEGHQRLISVSICLSVRPLRRKCDEDQLSNDYCTATASHIPHPPLPYPRHWGSPWLWRNLILLNLRFAHPRHWGPR